MARHIDDSPSPSPSLPEQSKKSKDDLWRDAVVKDIGDGASVQLVGVDSKNHTVFARVVDGGEDNGNKSKKAAAVTVGRVVEVMVDEGWRHVAKDILERHEHIERDSYPPANELLRLGAVWMLNETAYTEGKDAHARRLAEADECRAPDWRDMTLRVHYVPDRFHVANEYDWSKHCRGLLVGGNVEVGIGGETPHVPTNGFPDAKDGVIVYEDTDLGFAVLNKPGGMPDHATVSNHSEDVVSMFGAAAKERLGPDVKSKCYVHLPLRVDMEMQGLILVAIRKEFEAYMSTLIERKHNLSLDEDHNTGFMKKYRCLVAVKDPNKMDILQNFQKSGKIVTHYVDPKSPFPRKFVRHTPPSARGWQKCQLRVTKVGDGDPRFRAACVLSEYKDSVDCTLAHRLWGQKSAAPAEELGATYVMQLEIEMLTHRMHQIRGQLAALGFPIVGDRAYGGGACEVREHMHGWNRMALQCCEMSFFEPRWEEEDGGKKPRKLVPSERKCDFRLNDAWWTEYLEEYERNI